MVVKNISKFVGGNQKFHYFRQKKDEILFKGNAPSTFLKQALSYLIFLS